MFAAPRTVLPPPTHVGLRMEVHHLDLGAELVTVFGQLPGAGVADEIPLVTVLRDTLGDTDPDNDRLRYVWVHTSAPPTLLQRGAAFVPFFYFRPNLGKNADHRPSPALDLKDTANPVFTGLAESLTQVLALDPNGALVRSSTRSYRNNASDLQRQKISEALAVVRELEPDSTNSAFNESELLELKTRLFLAELPMGGLVSAQRLPRAYDKEHTRLEETRAHNWDLLRQRAEANGLYFEPFGLGESQTHALLWIARDEVNQKRSFDAQFLNIANPYDDLQLANWTGYTTWQNLNGQAVELIPLALYSLDYPKVPLLLADFRAAHNPKRSEMVRHAATDAVSGVLGISKWGNWPYLAGSVMFNFVTTRHGAARNRVARNNAYSEVREWLALDPKLDPDLRRELEKRLELLSINPLEASIAAEADIARRQYAALLKYADDPNGLPKRIEHDRNAELIAAEHSLKARAGMRTARVLSLGIYSEPELPPVELLAELDRERRAQHYRQFLETVVASGPQTEVVWNTDRIKEAVNGLAASGLGTRSAQLVERVRNMTTDRDTRDVCDRALENLDVGAGQ
ncbi:MAG: hypothetical protein JO307_26865 [Bryobacterales bacterium]|nr:hypothetical protein [Bryobacterales bacterium]MBV9398908.1 hypothetical protein [Bryobacterales bacterium]